MAGQNGPAGSGAKRATRQRFAHAVLATLLGVAICGCARRAPGPDECHDLAVAWVLGARVARSSPRKFSAPVDEAILERTTDCLTMPYDKELVQCVTRGASPRTCMVAFESRRPTPAGRLPR